MADEADPGSKTEAPSPRRLSEARARGDVAKSPDVASLASLLGGSLVLLLAGRPVAEEMIRRLLPFLERPDAMDMSGGGLLGVGSAAAQAALPGLWVLLAAVGAAVAANVLQQGFIWAPEKLVPDPSRLSPAKGFNRLYGIDGLAQFARSFLKLLAIGVTAFAILRPKAQTLENLSALDIAAVLPFALDLVRSLFLAVLVVLAIIALADYLWQRYRFIERLKMTREEVKEDSRQADGDPHVKAKIRQLRVKRARSRMIQAVPKATVVVMNPTHFAVALRYAQGETAAPVCVAKGVDALALKIRDVAQAHNVPVIEDPPLARALYAAMEIDEAIPREHYQAVAKVIGFVMGQAARRARPQARAAPGLR